MWLTQGGQRITVLMQLRSSQLKRGLAAMAATTADSGDGGGGGPTAVVTKKLDGVEKTNKKKKKKARRGSHVSSALPTTSSMPHDGDREGAQIVHRYENLVPARLLRRYKRFLADVVLLDAVNTEEEEEMAACHDDDDVVTIYCPNTGPMIGLLDQPNARVQLSKNDDPKRKYAYTLEMIRIHNGERHVWVGVHSASANRMVETALQARWLPQLGAFHSIRREVKFAGNSRVDFVLATKNANGDVVHEKYVEVKSVTLAQQILQGTDEDAADDDDDAKASQSPSERCAVFPDTVSTRAQKHVTELMELIAANHLEKAPAATSKPLHKNKGKENMKPPSETASRVTRSAAIIFLLQRDDCSSFMPSHTHDPSFAHLCARASANGIQLLGYSCRLEPHEQTQSGVVHLLRALPLHGAHSASE